MVMKTFVVVFVTLLALLLMLFAGYATYGNDFTSVASGNVVREKIIEFYEYSNIDNRTLIFIQLIAAVVAIAAIFFIFISIEKKKHLSKKDFEKNRIGKSQTDLDVLHATLKQKKEIGLTNVEKAFGVTSDIALGWAKILENADLAVLEYPRFGKPNLVLVEEISKEEAEEAKEKKLSKKEKGKIQKFEKREKKFKEKLEKGKKKKEAKMEKKSNKIKKRETRKKVKKKEIKTRRKEEKKAAHRSVGTKTLGSSAHPKLRNAGANAGAKKTKDAKKR